MDNKITVGSTIRNKNGLDYLVLAIKDDIALLYGDMNFLVAFDLSYTPYGYRWGGGAYFGCNIFGAVEKYKDKTNTIADSSYW